MFYKVEFYLYKHIKQNGKSTVKFCYHKPFTEIKRMISEKQGIAKTFLLHCGV